VPHRRVSPFAVALPLVAVLATATTAAAFRAGRGEPRGAPAELAVVADGHVALLETADPTLPPDGIGPDYWEKATSTAVAALGDGHVYYTAASRGDGCTSELQRVDREPTSTGFAPVGERVDGRVSALAVSPDDRQLAYVALVGNDGVCQWPVLHVRDLRTRRERVWRHGDGPTPPRVGSLSWAPDGRLAFEASQCCDDEGRDGIRILGLATPAGDFLDLPVLARGTRTSEREVCLLGVPAFRGTELVAVHGCGPGWSGARGFVRVVRVDPATGRIGRTLFALRGGYPDSLTFDRSGRHALIVTASRGAPPRLSRWDGGRSDAAVDLAGLPATAAAW
jgi:hypothetical protein